VIWVDHDAHGAFAGVIAKPNYHEAIAACRRAFGRIDYQGLRRMAESPLLVITCGARGALLIDSHKHTWVKAKRVENPVDICGAGDSFSAGAALTLKVTGDPSRRLASESGGFDHDYEKRHGYGISC